MGKFPQENQVNNLQRKMLQATRVIAIAAVLHVILAFLAFLL